MRRLLLPALCAGALAVPIPMAIAQSGPRSAPEVATELAAYVAGERARWRLERSELRREARSAQRAAKRRATARRAFEAVAVPPHLEAIAQCESGGDPRAVSANGMYHGKYQFSVATWRAVGGSGLPSRAPEAEQDMRAAMLYARSGPGQWPVCGG